MSPSPLPPQILIVDDEPDLEPLFLQRFRRAIANGQYQFVFASDGVEALEKLREFPEIAVILTDINMPRMDGLTLLGEIEKLGAQTNRVMKALVVSAYGDMDNIRAAMNRGAFDFIIKPMNFEDVETAIQKTLDYVGHLRESRRAEEYRVGKSVAEANFSRLQELEKMRDNLVHMIVHDLRTPLTAIMLGLQSLAVLGEMNALQQESVRAIFHSSNALLDMINDLLNVSKMENGSLQLNLGDVEFALLAPRIIEQVQALADHKKIALSSDLGEELPRLSADEELLCRVVVNLLSNAIKFTPRGGAVSLHAQREASGELRLAVRDNGAGIPPEAFEYIFDKFTQVGTQASSRSSAGLGLAFCKLAVEAHAGRIWVESEVGQGSTFYCVFPGE